MSCSRILLLIHLVVLNFRLWLMVEKKGIFLTNRISLLMSMFLLSFIIYLGSVIYSFNTGPLFICVLFIFDAAMLGPYIFLVIM